MTAPTPSGETSVLIVPYKALKPSHEPSHEIPREPRKPTPNATIERLKRAVRRNPTPNRPR